MSAIASLDSLAAVLPIEIHIDARGWLFEIARQSQGVTLAQVYAVGVAPGQTRGKHYHRRKTELFAVVHGTCRLHLRDTRTDDEQSIVLGPQWDIQAVIIPPMVWHAFSNDVNTPAETAVVIACPSEEYNPADEDTYRDA